MSDSVKDTILEVMEASLEAQLKAVRQLRKAVPAPQSKPLKGKSQVDMVYDVLLEAGMPLHLREIISRVDTKFSVALDSDSLVSALTKRVLKGDRFNRPAKNTFGLLEAGHAG
jgi:hypothetical protein